jgi:hypothetical protein
VPTVCRTHFSRKVSQNNFWHKTLTNWCQSWIPFKSNDKIGKVSKNSFQTSVSVFQSKIDFTELLKWQLRFKTFAFEHWNFEESAWQLCDSFACRWLLHCWVINHHQEATTTVHTPYSPSLPPSKIKKSTFFLRNMSLFTTFYFSLFYGFVSASQPYFNVIKHFQSKCFTIIALPGFS